MGAIGSFIASLGVSMGLLTAGVSEHRKIEENSKKIEKIEESSKKIEKIEENSKRIEKIEKDNDKKIKKIEKDVTQLKNKVVNSKNSSDTDRKFALEKEKDEEKKTVKSTEDQKNYQEIKKDIIELKDELKDLKNEKTRNFLHKKLFYSKVNVGVGYGYQFKDAGFFSYAGDVNERFIVSRRRRNGYDVLANFGYNIYLKASKTINPFIGFDIQGRFGNGREYRGEEYIVERGGYNNYSLVTGLGVQFKEYGRLALKLGTKINNFFEIYALGGANVAKIDREYESYIGSITTGDKQSKVNIGYVYGAGINFIIYDRITMGLEWYTSNNNVGAFKANIIDNKIRMNNVSLKIGCQF